MKSHTLQFTVCIVLFLILSHPAAAGAEPKIYPLQRFVSIGSGDINARYYSLAVEFSRILNQSGDIETVLAVPTSGSVDNIHLLRNGDLRYAFCQADIFQWAIKGEGAFDGDPVRNLRALAAVYDEVVHCVVREDSGIKAWTELPGRRLVLGPPGSGSRLTGEWILQHEGMKLSEFQLLDHSIADGLDALIEGQADALLLVSALPSDLIAEGARLSALRFLPLNWEEKPSRQFYQKAVIPAKSYAGQEVDVPSISLAALLVCLADCSADEGEQLLRRLLAYLENLSIATGSQRKDPFAGIPLDYLQEGARRLKNLQP